MNWSAAGFKKHVPIQILQKMNDRAWVAKGMSRLKFLKLIAIWVISFKYVLRFGLFVEIPLIYYSLFIIVKAIKLKLFTAAKFAVQITYFLLSCKRTAFCFPRLALHKEFWQKQHNAPTVLTLKWHDIQSFIADR